MPKPYHRFVWDLHERKFVGRFDEMYAAEDEEEFDSWQQGDLTRISRPLAKLLIDRISYRRALDLGCGKGALTGLLWKENCDITAIDVSTVAIAKAKAVYGDKIHFLAGDVVEYLEGASEPFDLIFAAEVLSYLENWRQVIGLAARRTTYFYCSLYLPDDPIGYVKSGEELRMEIGKHFDLVHDLEIHTVQTRIILAKVRS